VPLPSSFDYAVLRIVPRVEREEFLNAGVVLYCRARDFLGARVHLDRPRLAALAPDADAEAFEVHLATVVATCRGGPGAGPLASLSQAERFHWLVAPRSTVVQVSPVHSGLCEDPQATLDELVERLVLTDHPAKP
jgi:hypothetical protein